MAGIVFQGCYARGLAHEAPRGLYFGSDCLARWRGDVFDVELVAPCLAPASRIDFSAHDRVEWIDDGRDLVGKDST